MQLCIMMLSKNYIAKKHEYSPIFIGVVAESAISGGHDSGSNLVAYNNLPCRHFGPRSPVHFQLGCATVIGMLPGRDGVGIGSGSGIGGVDTRN